MIFPIKNVVDVITNADPSDISSNYALVGTRGFRFDRLGMIGYRDYGTINRYSSYPSVTIAGHFNLYIPNEASEYDVLFGYDSLGYLRIYIGNGSTWDELTKVYSVTLDATPSATSSTGTFTSVLDLLSSSVTLGLNDLSNYIAVNVTGTNRGESVLVLSSTPTSFTGLPYLGSSGLSWVSGDTVFFYRMTGILPDLVLGTGNGYQFLNGATPHLRYIPVEAQQKLSLLYGSSNTPPTMRTPVRIQKGYFTVDGSVASSGSELYYYFDDWDGTRPVHLFRLDTYIGNDVSVDTTLAYSFGATQTTYRLGTSIGWNINRAFLSADYIAGDSSTAGSPVLTTTTPMTDAVIGEGIKVAATYSSNNYDSNKNHTRHAMTILYRGYEGTVYEESDPVFKLFLSPSATESAQVVPTVHIDLSKLNKSIAGFRWYMAQKNNNDIPNGMADWADSSEDYYMVKEALISDSTWAQVLTSQYSYSYALGTIDKLDYDEAVATGASTLDGNMGHAIDINRTDYTPRFTIRASRGQSAITIIDKDDRTLVATCYDGSGVHNDDKYLDLESDNSGRQQNINLNGRGTIKGLAYLNGRVLVFREAELEIFLLDNNISDIIPCDFSAKDSLIGVGLNDSPMGVAWCGNNGLYFLPSDGGQIQPLGIKQRNFFNGELLTDDGTPYVTDAFRQAIHAGYCQATNEIVFHVEANKKDNSGTEYLGFFYSAKDGRCRIRKFPSKVIAFTSKNDGTMTWVTASGLLKYPYKQATGSAHIYEDNVTSAGVSASTGIETKIRISVGELSSPSDLAKFKNHVLDYVAESTSNNQFTLKLYEGDASDPFDTIYYRTNNPIKERLNKPVGTIQNLQIEVELPSTNLHEFKKFDLRNINLETVWVS